MFVFFKPRHFPSYLYLCSSSHAFISASLGASYLLSSWTPSCCLHLNAAAKRKACLCRYDTQVLANINVWRCKTLRAIVYSLKIVCLGHISSPSTLQGSYHWPTKNKKKNLPAGLNSLRNPHPIKSLELVNKARKQVQLSHTGKVADLRTSSSSDIRQHRNNSEDCVKLDGENWRKWLEIHIRPQHLLKWREKERESRAKTGSDL